MTKTISTYAEQVELAARAHARIGSRVTIAGRAYTVSRHGADIRFHGVAKYQGENPAGAIVDCLRADLAVGTGFAGGHRDRVLEAACAAIVGRVMAGAIS